MKNKNKNMREFVKQRAKVIGNTETRTATAIKQDVINWMYYDNEPRREKYEYMIKKGDARMPMYTVHIPCQRPIIDLLISQQAKRVWQFSTFTVDKESVKAKWEAKQKAYLDAEMNKRKSMVDFYEDNIFQIQLRLQQIQEMAQKEPQSEEEAQQQQQLVQQMPLVNHEFQKIMKQFYEMIELTQEEKDKIEYYYSYSYKDIREEIAQRAMSKLRSTFEVKAKSISNFKQKTVIGREAWLVYVNENTKRLEYDTLNCINIKYPHVKGIKYIQDLPWVSVVDTITQDAVKEMYGDELKKEGVDLEQPILKSLPNVENKHSFISTPGHGAIYTGALDSKKDIIVEEGIKRERIWFRELREVNFKVSKNMRDDAIVKEFIHMIPMDKVVINKEKYKYVKVETEDNKDYYYINKNDKTDRYLASDVVTYDPATEKIIKRYTYDRYSCVIINNEWVVDIRKDLFVNRSKDRHAKFCLPVFGRTHSSQLDKPYSIIKNTIDLQDLYNSIYMLRQLAYAIAGAKGQIIDKSQKPDGMLMDEWEANIAQGRLYIQTVDSSGRKINNSFNQWTSFDNTVSSSVQYYDNVLIQIKETMGEIVGVPRQRQAQIVKGDLVGNTEIALEQASLITEILYEEHDEIEAKALNELLSLHLKYGKVDNTYLEFNDRTEGREIFYLPEDLFKDVDIEVNVYNSTKEQGNLEMMKSILQNEYAKGALDAHDLSVLIDIDSITEMRKKTEQIIKRKNELMQQQQSSLIEQQKESAKEVEQFKADLEMQAQQHSNLIAEKQLEIAAFLAQAKAQVDEQNVLLKQHIENMKHERELAKIANEDKVEMSYLAEQSKSTNIQQRLTAMQMRLDALFNAFKLGLDNKALDNDLNVKTKKIAAESKKAEAMPKKNPEHLKDN